MLSSKHPSWNHCLAYDKSGSGESQLRYWTQSFNFWRFLQLIRFIWPDFYRRSWVVLLGQSCSYPGTPINLLVDIHCDGIHKQRCGCARSSVLPLIEEILHHPGCIKPYKYWDKLPTSPGWQDFHQWYQGLEQKDTLNHHLFGEKSPINRPSTKHHCFDRTSETKAYLSPWTPRARLSRPHDLK